MTKARDNANGGFGLVLMKPSSIVNGTDNGKGTVSFTGQSTVSLNGCFNSIYTNYKIQFIFTAPTSTNSLTMRLRASSTDTSANYKNQNIVSNSTNIQARQNDTGTDDWYIGADFNNGTIAEMTLFRPQTATKTSFLSSAFSPYPATQYLQLVGGEQTDSTQFDGFTIANASDIAGTISVYGYNN